jgi:hypothetical protein
LPDFSGKKPNGNKLYPNGYKLYQMVTNYTKWPQTIPNGHKIYQMAKNNSKWSRNLPEFSILSLSGIYPNRDFWYENKPSGNPAAPLTNSKLVSGAKTGIALKPQRRHNEWRKDTGKSKGRSSVTRIAGLPYFSWHRIPKREKYTTK